MKKEREPVIKKMISDMRALDITPEDIAVAYSKGHRGASARKTGASVRVAVKGKSVVPAKYRNPETGETWTGRGRAPRWMAEAEAAVQTRDAFEIQHERNDTPPLNTSDNKESPTAAVEQSNND